MREAPAPKAPRRWRWRSLALGGASSRRRLAAATRFRTVRRQASNAKLHPDLCAAGFPLPPNPPGSLRRRLPAPAKATLILAPQASGARQTHPDPRAAGFPRPLSPPASLRRRLPAPAKPSRMLAPQASSRPSRTRRRCRSSAVPRVTGSRPPSGSRSRCRLESARAKSSGASCAYW